MACLPRMPYAARFFVIGSRKIALRYLPYKPRRDLTFSDRFASDALDLCVSAGVLLESHSECQKMLNKQRNHEVAGIMRPLRPKEPPLGPDATSRKPNWPRGNLEGARGNLEEARGGSRKPRGGSRGARGNLEEARGNSPGHVLSQVWVSTLEGD